MVSTRNSERALKACLSSPRGQTRPDIEWLVVDNCSTEGTTRVARRLADRVIEWGPERSAQGNHDVAFGSAEFCLFLDRDLCLEPGVAGQAVGASDQDSGFGVLVVPGLAFGEGFWAACRVLEKRLYLGAREVEAAHACERDVFEESGSFDDALTGIEDWELPDRLQARGYPIGSIQALARRDEGSLRIVQTFRKKRYHGRTARNHPRNAPQPALWQFIGNAPVARPGLVVAQPHYTVGLLLLQDTRGCGICGQHA
ncbi:MAG: glycosyltransferase family 2 protein [Acidimicrobiia bacterium]